MLTVAPGGFLGLGDGVEDGQIQVGLAAATGRDTADDLGAVIEALLTMKGALLAGETLANHLRILVDHPEPIGHRSQALSTERALVLACLVGEEQVMECPEAGL